MEFSSVCITVGDWELICVFQMVMLAGSLVGGGHDLVFLLPLLLCHHVVLGQTVLCWDHHLFRSCHLI